MENNKIIDNSFGEYLKKIREAKGLSLRELSRRIGIDPSNLSKIEKGMLRPPSDIKKLESMAFELGMRKTDYEYCHFIKYAILGSVCMDLFNEYLNCARDVMEHTY